MAARACVRAFVCDWGWGGSRRRSRKDAGCARHCHVCVCARQTHSHTPTHTRAHAEYPAMHLIIHEPPATSECVSVSALFDGRTPRVFVIYFGGSARAQLQRIMKSFDNNCVRTTLHPITHILAFASAVRARRVWTEALAPEFAFIFMRPALILTGGLKSPKLTNIANIVF